MIMFLFGMSVCVYMVIFAYDQYYFGVCMCVIYMLVSVFGSL